MGIHIFQYFLVLVNLQSPLILVFIKVSHIALELWHDLGHRLVVRLHKVLNKPNLALRSVSGVLITKIGDLEAKLSLAVSLVREFVENPVSPLLVDVEGLERIADICCMENQIKAHRLILLDRVKVFRG